MEIKQAVIFAGGQGTRLLPLTKNIPKPMVKVNGKPFLYYLLKLLKDEGVKKVLILLGYKGEVIKKYCEKEKPFGLKIEFSVGETDWETGKRLIEAEPQIDENFLLMYCDNYWPLQLKKLLSFHEKHGKKATMTVYGNREKITRNNVYVNDKGLIEVYDKTRTHPGLNAVDIGFFILSKKLLKLIPRNNASFEKTVFPKLVEQKQLAGYLTHHRYFSNGDLEKLKTSKSFFKAKKVVFLDRDGVINKKAPKAEYVRSWKDFKFLPGVLDALKILKKENFKIIIVSNQAGIARKQMTENDLKEIHKKMLNEIKKHGGKIDAIYHCPHGWDENCLCRKPNPGMFFEAVHDHLINLRESYFIGDDPRDKIVGDEIGCTTYLVEDIEPQYKDPKFYFQTLKKAVEHIIKIKK